MRWRRVLAWSALASLAAAGCDVAIPVVERIAGGGASDATAIGEGDGGGNEAATLAPVDSGSVASGPFGPASLVTAVSDSQSDNEDPSLSADGLELYFMSTRGGSNDIWVSSRVTPTDPWGTPTLVSEVSTIAGEAEPFIASDRLTLWFTTNRDVEAGAGYHIWITTRATLSSAWDSPQPVSELWSPGTDGKPAVDEAELVMAFMSDRDGGAGGMDLYTTTRATRSDPWGGPVNVVEVNTAADERDPFLGPQDLQLFWATSTPSQEIASVSRSSTVQLFSSSQIFNELGTPDFDDTLSPDLRHILFARGPAGNQEIYEAFR